MYEQQTCGHIRCYREEEHAHSPLQPIQTSEMSAAMTQELATTMASYVPNFIRKDLAVDHAPPVDPNIASFPSCILFIDVSGFTALNERLGKLGRGGPEQVSKHLNAYFGQLIDAVNNQDRKSTL